VSFLLDTNVVSETAKPQPAGQVVQWLKAHRGVCALASVTVAEMRYGIERLPESKRKAMLETKFKFLAEQYADQLYEFDGPAASEWGRYAAQLEAEYGVEWWKRFDLRDTMIAAIAREYGLIIATRNTNHFPFCQTVNPFLENPPDELPT
jgi:toxin FitB